MIRSLDEKVFSCVVLTSAHFFFFFSIFRMTSTNRHHIILFYWTWRTNCIYPLVRKKCIVFPGDRRFKRIWSDSQFSYHIGINDYTKFYAYNIYNPMEHYVAHMIHIVLNVILCLNLNLYLVVMKINESILFKHPYKFLFLVRFLQYWFMWPHV